MAFQYGITPACAGKSFRDNLVSRQLQDHPRACGEKPQWAPITLLMLGSPPHMRGKERRQYMAQLGPGITPACAGKRLRAQSGCKTLGDHPRVCGEKAARVDRPEKGQGSPPRVRGKARGASLLCQHLRITPVCAGKRQTGRTLMLWSGDHPRVCGEKLLSVTTMRSFLGSPPPVRGKVHFLKVRLNERGITPACAGKSSIQHLTASLGEFEVQKGHPVPHLRQRLQVWPDHARHLRHGLILHASRSAGQGRRLCPGPCPDTAGSGTPRDPSPAKRPHTSPPAATPGGCRAWQSGATAPGSR